MIVMDVIVANAIVVAASVAVASDAIAAAIAVAVVVGKEEDSWDTGARGPVHCNGIWEGETTIGNENRIGRV
jgi:hypothetical protein